MNFIFEPVCFDHAAALIHKTPWEVSGDAVLLAEAHLAAARRYRLDACVVGMDIYNLEPEAYGAEVLRPDGNGIPTLAEERFEELSELSAQTLDLNAGRIPLLLDAAGRVASAEPGLRVSVAISGPFTIAAQLLGLENMICEAFAEPEAAAAGLQHLANQEKALIRHIRGAGFSIAVYESAVAPPLLSPDLFRKVVAPALDSVLCAAEGEAQLIIGGNTLPILPELFHLSAAYRICPVETDQSAFLQAVPRGNSGTLRVNLRPGVFLPGCGEEARAELARVETLCASRPDLQLRCGALIPYDADPGIVAACRRG
ncbi:MAG: hypothetical protein LAT79_03200 [Kiritimatiellae bacterium]|nr:hypothetical protein [Kiritimatiellia bacterium]